jgi:hypothetical protein
LLGKILQHRLQDLWFMGANQSEGGDLSRRNKPCARLFGVTLYHVVDQACRDRCDDEKKNG